SMQIWIFVQGRWVLDRSLQAAVMEGYRNLLMHGEFPLVALFVSLDPEDIDVNIHPTKSQVKFVDPRGIFSACVSCIRNAHEKAPWLKPTQAPRSNFMESVASSSLSFQQPEFQNISFKTKYPNNDFGTSSVRETLRTYSQGRAFERSESEPEPEVPAPSVEASSTSYWSRFQVLGQAHLTYILAQDEEKLYLIDQHAAHERVAFERLMAAWKGGKIEVQNYLVPLVLDLEASDCESLLGVKEDLAKLGVHISSMGPSSLAIEAAPPMLSEKALSIALEKMASEINEQGGSYSLERAIADLCATMACHSVVRAGQSLSFEEMKSLLQQMDEFPLSSFCPHGRPVCVEYPFARIERDFGRIC
ncbi:MAG: DNA mismatch repair protein MutL, partial [Bdellovibrionales bacterium]|nr:DNA mismatch repair protein MutL [Bdellovibrionales bacterium]